MGFSGWLRRRVYGVEGDWVDENVDQSDDEALEAEEIDDSDGATFGTWEWADDELQEAYLEDAELGQSFEEWFEEGFFSDHFAAMVYQVDDMLDSLDAGEYGSWDTF